jgi:hypothetical protein
MLNPLSFESGEVRVLKAVNCCVLGYDGVWTRYVLDASRAEILEFYTGPGTFGPSEYNPEVHLKKL